MSARYITGKELKIWRFGSGPQLRAEIDGYACILSAKLKRVFPLSATDQYFSIQDVDDKELAILKSKEGLEADSLAILEAELDRRYYSPQITRIKDLKIVPGMLSFDVETNRGDTVFFVRNWRESSHEIETFRWHITSVDGQRFEIPDLNLLDRRSQSLVEQLL